MKNSDGRVNVDDDEDEDDDFSLVRGDGQHTACSNIEISFRWKPIGTSEKNRTSVSRTVNLRGDSVVGAGDQDDDDESAVVGAQSTWSMANHKKEISLSRTPTGYYYSKWDGSTASR